MLLFKTIIEKGGKEMFKKSLVFLSLFALIALGGCSLF
jgi:hypothetical protein